MYATLENGELARIKKKALRPSVDSELIVVQSSMYLV